MPTQNFSKASDRRGGHSLQTIIKSENRARNVDFPLVQDERYLWPLKVEMNSNVREIMTSYFP